jgi:hypothetical protein
VPTHHPSPSEALAGVLRSAGLSPTPEQLALLIEYKTRLLEWNDTTNLISQNTIATFDRVHILDSLLPLRWLPEEGPVVDLGTGGGMPGIIIKIFRPEVRVTLAESKSRKIKFLQKAVAALNLEGLDVINPTLEKPEAVYRVLVSAPLGPWKNHPGSKTVSGPRRLHFRVQGKGSNRPGGAAKHPRGLALRAVPLLVCVDEVGAAAAERTAVLLRRDP